MLYKNAMQQMIEAVTISLVESNMSEFDSDAGLWD